MGKCNLLFLLGVSCVAAIHVDVSCSTRGPCIWPNYEYCNQFWRCDNGVARNIHCPLHLLFNIDGEYCDYEHNVDCGERVNPFSLDPLPSSFKSDVCLDDVTERFFPGEFCDQFVICKSEIPFTYSCPTNYLYNTLTNSCEMKQKVDCGNRPDRFEVKRDYEIICNFDKRDGATKYCNEYYVCYDETAIIHRCPIGMLFNELTKSCDWYDNVNCGDRINQFAIETIATTAFDDNINDANPNPEKVCDENLSDGGLITHMDCSKYYICTEVGLIIQRCATNLLFNPKKNLCDWHQNVDCGDRELTENNQTVTTVDFTINDYDPNPEETCQTTISNGKLISHKNCGKFYICIDGHLLTENCANNLLFNTETLICDLALRVKCGNRLIYHNPATTTTMKTITTNQRPKHNIHDAVLDPGEDCAKADAKDVFFFAHKNCNQFYICLKNKLRLLNCTTNLVFNIETSSCDKQDTVDCGNRKIPTNSIKDPDPDPKKTCAAENTNGKLLAHRNCNQYYICVNAISIVETCESNLLFNTRNSMCEEPHAVNCSGRILSNDKETDTTTFTSMNTTTSIPFTN